MARIEVGCKHNITYELRVSVPHTMCVGGIKLYKRIYGFVFVFDFCLTCIINKMAASSKRSSEPLEKKNDKCQMEEESDLKKNTG